MSENEEYCLRLCPLREVDRDPETGKVTTIYCLSRTPEHVVTDASTCRFPRSWGRREAVRQMTDRAKFIK